MRVGCGCLVYILLVFPLLLISILLAGIITWALDRSFYEESLANSGFYEELWEQGSFNLSGTGMSQAFGSVPPFALNAGMRAVLTAEDFRAMTQQAINGFFDALEGNTDQFVFTFDLMPIRTALSGAGATQFANAYVAALPECQGSQSSLSPGSSLPVCREDDVSEATLASQVAESMPAIVQALPTEFRVEQEVELPDIQGVPLRLSNLRTTATYGVLIIAGLALLLWLANGLILGRGARNRLLWLGLILLIPAGLVMLLGIVVSNPTFEATIREAITRGSPARDAQQALSFMDVVWSAGDRVRTGFLLAGGIPTLFAVILLIFGLAIRPSDKNKNDGRYVQMPAR